MDDREGLTSAYICVDLPRLPAYSWLTWVRNRTIVDTHRYEMNAKKQQVCPSLPAKGARARPPSRCGACRHGPGVAGTPRGLQRCLGFRL